MNASNNLPPTHLPTPLSASPHCPQQQLHPVATCQRHGSQTDYHPNFNLTLPSTTTNPICTLHHHNSPGQKQHIHGCCPPVPCNTLEWPILIALACNRLELGRLLSNSATRTAAAHQFTSIPLPSYTCSALLPLLHLHLPLTYKSALPWPRWSTPTPWMQLPAFKTYFSTNSTFCNKLRQWPKQRNQRTVL